ncbi:MAG: type II secretion system protein, partial [Nitrospirales bacterium]
VTFLEMLVTLAIIMILASVALPLTKHTSKRTKELELRQTLRQMRMAIDEFHRDWARDGDLLTGPQCVKNKLTCKEVTGVTGYPKTLKTLLEIELSGGEAAVGGTIPVRRYLRQIPIDPITGAKEWALRCYQDSTDTREWCSEDVFDVHSTSTEEAIDGSAYRDW